MNTTPFTHTMAAHCESGTLTGLLCHGGLSISEPMVFGIAGGIFFGYFDSPKFPFPTFACRSMPGDLRKQISKRLGVQFDVKKFGDPVKAERDMDDLLARAIPLEIQVDMFYMEYVPAYMRAHFNAHFITAVAKEGNSYVVSDCYYPELALLSLESMRIARFARGDFAPQGLRIYPTDIPLGPDMPLAIRKGIKHACFYMLKLPIPFLGVRGIRRFADKVVTWPKRARDIDHLSHEIMSIHLLLEERGTGGGGFRFMYASFLQEASKITGNKDLESLSHRMMTIGDHWRDISLFVARIGRQRDLGHNRMLELREMIMVRADEEERFFKDLAEANT